MKPFGYWHQGDSEEESDFHLFSESGEVACSNCLVLYTQQQVDELVAQIEESKRKLAEQQALILRYRKDYLDEHSDEETDYCVTPLDESLYNGTRELSALLTKAKEEGKKEAVPEDTARLDYLISHDAFVVKRKADSGAITYQLWTQDEDEVHHVLHEESIFLRSPREAIDAAMLAAAPKPPGE